MRGSCVVGTVRERNRLLRVSVHEWRTGSLRRGSGSASGAGRLDLARRQVDLRPRIAQVPLADPVVQVDDAMDPRIVLDGELAELRIDGELVAEPLVEPLHLVALFVGQLLGLFELVFRERRSAGAGRPRP